MIVILEPELTLTVKIMAEKVASMAQDAKVREFYIYKVSIVQVVNLQSLCRVADCTSVPLESLEVPLRDPVVAS